MKRLCIVLVALLAGVAPALAGGPLSLGVQADAANLSVAGTWKDVYGMGYGGGAHLDLSLVVVSARLSVDYMSFSPDNGKYQSALQGLTGGAASNFTIDGGTVSILSVNANAKLPILPLPIIKPYVTGGLGLARINVSSITVKYQGVPQSNIAGVGSDTRSSFNLGAGVDLELGLTLYLEAKYTWILTPNTATTYLPITLGVTF